MRFLGIFIFCELALGLELPSIGLIKRHNGVPDVNDLMYADWKRSVSKRSHGLYEELYPEMYTFAKRGKN